MKVNLKKKFGFNFYLKLVKKSFIVIIGLKYKIFDYKILNSFLT